MQWSEKPPAGVEALAKGEREHVWYGEMRLGDGKPMTIAIAMVPPAQAKPEAPLAAGSCRIYLDLNGDRSLTDQDPLVAVKRHIGGRGSMLVTPEVRVPVTYALKDGSQVQHDYCFRLALEPQATYKPMLAMMISSAWTGTIRLGDRNVAVRVSDTSGNAKLRVASPTAGNTITLPPEQTQGAPQPTMMPGGGQPLTRYIGYGGAFYHIEVREDGAQISVTPMEVPPGGLLMTATDGRGRPLAFRQATVIGDSFYGRVTMRPAGTPIPPGWYSIQYTLAQPGKTTPGFSFIASRVVVRSGETTKLVCGGPMKLTVTVGQDGRNRDDVNLHVSTTAQNAAGHGFFFGESRDPKRVPWTTEVFTSSLKRVGSTKTQPG
jgi:hypothetical protein